MNYKEFKRLLIILVVTQIIIFGLIILFEITLGGNSLSNIIEHIINLKNKIMILVAYVFITLFIVTFMYSLEHNDY